MKLNGRPTETPRDGNLSRFGGGNQHRNRKFSGGSVGEEAECGTGGVVCDQNGLKMIENGGEFECV